MLEAARKLKDESKRQVRDLKRLEERCGGLKERCRGSKARWKS